MSLVALFVSVKGYIDAIQITLAN